MFKAIYSHGDTPKAHQFFKFKSTNSHGDTPKSHPNNYLPVEPKPPSPLTVESSSSTTEKLAVSYGVNTI